MAVCWDCLQGSGAPTLHAESKGSCWLLQRVWKKKPAVPGRIPWFPLAHYCRFVIRRPEERHAFKVQRGRHTHTHSRGEANGHGCFRTGTQTDTVQPGTGEQIPDTFLGSADQPEEDTFRIESLSWFWDGQKYLMMVGQIVFTAE